MIVFAMSWYLDYNKSLDLMPKLIESIKSDEDIKNEINEEYDENEPDPEWNDDNFDMNQQGYFDEVKPKLKKKEEITKNKKINTRFIKKIIKKKKKKKKNKKKKKKK